ncbi:DUF2846 domain-containing protein [Mucilaginibacter flavidus]|uniref:DUF2846 domain-containing protein n=1 Tax=Mucilaginibacter flavidus TaxID=2949309 RepID=UPI002093FFCA|nr:DUF2846 domain-containing protein [Mucilaginibacter flavidus]MCO5946662.1 DUF2846 domain-containing protein [Mucilaginibacter flavidus]
MKPNNSITQKILVNFYMLASLVLSGCSTGPKYIAAPPPKPGSALVYVYRKYSNIGAAEYGRVFVNSNFLTILRGGGYAPYEAAQGKVVFYIIHRTDQYVNTRFDSLTNVQKTQYEKLRMEVEPGKTYYVRLSVSSSGFGMIPVDTATGAKEIKGLRLGKVRGDK